MTDDMPQAFAHSLDGIVSRAFDLARDRRFDRARAFLLRAADRIPLRNGAIAPEKSNLLALADLIGAPESRDATGALRGYGPLPGVTLW